MEESKKGNKKKGTKLSLRKKKDADSSKQSGKCVLPRLDDLNESSEFTTTCPKVKPVARIQREVFTLDDESDEVSSDTQGTTTYLNI